jgi:hypothetical protein
MVAEQKGYHVLTYLTHENNTNEVSTVRHLLGGRVDGVLMSLCRDTQSIDHLTSLQESGIPLVFFDRVPEQISCPTVTTDDYESGFRATEHLIQSGCKRIACLSLSHYLSISNKRMNGYIYALKKQGAEVRLCGPSTLIPKHIQSLGVEVSHDVKSTLAWCDAANVLRIQLERQQIKYFPSLREYAQTFGITRKMLDELPKEIILMHPGPINRGVELSSDAADSPHSIILDQVENGVAIRMAVLYLLASRG